METISIKPKRGRPPKYSIDERYDQYKLLSKNWCKQNYDQKAQILSSNANTYQKRLREAYSLLQELWLNKDLIDNINSDEYIKKLNVFFNKDKINL